jgi:hypothetical protein
MTHILETTLVALTFAGVFGGMLVWVLDLRSTGDDEW